MTDKEIFENGSKTYYWSSRFFPKGVRDDIFKLYSFVRVVDDYVDKPKPDIVAFKSMRRRWNIVKKQLGSEYKRVDDSVAERVLSNIVYIVHRYDCDPAWVDAFFLSMQMDIDQRQYKNLDETLEYIYGSAEVIGYLVAKILRLRGSDDASSDTMHYAAMQGRAMQFINFIRDIEEDRMLGRCYFPKSDLVMFGLKELSEHEMTRKPAEFREFIEFQVARYNEWQKVAKKGFRRIPKRLRIAVRTAVDMYNWTGRQLADEPSIIFEKKVKPSKTRILRSGVKRTLYG